MAVREFQERESYWMRRSSDPRTEMAPSNAFSVKETPPDDDVCPVCFGDFVLPCRSNCGHWFCGSCILQVWNFSSALQACKCPMCCRCIKNLELKASVHQHDEDEVKKIMKSIERYNRLFVGGARGFVLKLYGTPLFLGRIFHDMTDPTRIDMHVHSWRLLAITLGYLYLMCPFKFIPESVNVINLCNTGSLLIVLLIKVIGFFQSRRSADNVRRMAAQEIHE